jgi:hypothetical protein
MWPFALLVQSIKTKKMWHLQIPNKISILCYHSFVPNLPQKNHSVQFILLIHCHPFSNFRKTPISNNYGLL